MPSSGSGWPKAHPFQFGSTLAQPDPFSPLQVIMLYLTFLDLSISNFQPPLRSLDGYKHIVDVQYCPPLTSEGPHFPPEAAKAKEAAQAAPNIQIEAEYHDIMEGK